MFALAAPALLLPLPLSELRGDSIAIDGEASAASADTLVAAASAMRSDLGVLLACSGDCHRHQPVSSCPLCCHNGARQCRAMRRLV